MVPVSSWKLEKCSDGGWSMEHTQSPPSQPLLIARTSYKYRLNTRNQYYKDERQNKHPLFNSALAKFSIGCEKDSLFRLGIRGRSELPPLTRHSLAQQSDLSLPPQHSFPKTSKIRGLSSGQWKHLHIPEKHSLLGVGAYGWGANVEKQR